MARRSLGLLAAVLCIAGTTPVAAQWTFIRGDANGDGSVNIADPIQTLGYLFQGSSVACQDALDANDDGGLDIADAVHSLDVLFGTGGATFPPPSPTCGDDPTADALGCVGPVPSCPALPIGCVDNSACPPGEYCAKALGDCNGTGTCMVMPIACPAIFDPVCGCDGVSYSNACEAALAGVNVETAGLCGPPPGSCLVNGDCPPGQFCQKATGDCTGLGNCVVMPFICTTIFDPVCGCNGQTYSNACVAAAAGQSIDYLGPC